MLIGTTAGAVLHQLLPRSTVPIYDMAEVTAGTMQHATKAEKECKDTQYLTAGGGGTNEY